MEHREQVTLTAYLIHRSLGNLDSASQELERILEAANNDGLPNLTRDEISYLAERAFSDYTKLKIDSGSIRAKHFSEVPLKILCDVYSLKVF